MFPFSWKKPAGAAAMEVIRRIFFVPSTLA
jgi:hypothetical protein